MSNSPNGIDFGQGKRNRDIISRVTSMLVTNVGDQICWWQILDVGDRFRMLVTDLIHRNHQHNEKIANVMILPPTSDVTNITVTHIEAWKSYDDGFKRERLKTCFTVFDEKDVLLFKERKSFNFWALNFYQFWLNIFFLFWTFNFETNKRCKMQNVKDVAYTVSRLLQKIDVRYPNKDVMTS